MRQSSPTDYSIAPLGFRSSNMTCQMSRFVDALRFSGVNDNEAFATTLFTREGYWRIALDASEPPYASLRLRGWPSIYESAIYSVSGEWAVAVADEEFALAGGSEWFIQSLTSRMSEFKEAALREFVLHWRSEVAGWPPDAVPNLWIPEVLHHVYGIESERWLRLYRGLD